MYILKHSVYINIYIKPSNRTTIQYGLVGFFCKGTVLIFTNYARYRELADFNSMDTFPTQSLLHISQSSVL